MKETIKSALRRLVPKGLQKEWIEQGKREAFAGRLVKCPCCGHEALTFLPGGVRPRPHARCVHCGSLERHRLMWLFLKEHTELFSRPHRVLHIAPEKIFFRTFRRMPHIDYVPGAKFDLEFPDEYPNGTVDVDLTNISFSEASFDAIICSHVLKHIPDDAQAMRELYRVLRPGGWAILQVPLDLSREKTYEDATIVTPEGRERAFGQRDHVRWYGRDYPDRLRQAGFDVQADDMSRRMTQQERFHWGVLPEEDIYFCTKPR